MKKVILIGLGYTAQIVHLKTIFYEKDLEIIGIFDERPKLRLLIQNKYKIKYNLKNIQDIKKINEKIDFAVVCADRSKQFTYLKQLLQLKIDCLCEKPFALSAKEAEKISKISKKNNAKCIIGFMKCHSNLSKKLKSFIKKKIFDQKNYVICNLFNGDLRNNAFWRFKSNEKLLKLDEKKFLNKKINKNKKISFLIFINRYWHSLNLIFYLFEIKLNNIKDLELRVIDNVTMNLSFKYINSFFNFNFGENNINKWKEDYSIISKNYLINLDFESPFNLQNCGKFKIATNKNETIFDMNSENYSWSFQNQLKYFIKNYKSKKLINSIDSCAKELKLIENLWL